MPSQALDVQLHVRISQRVFANWLLTGCFRDEVDAQRFTVPCADTPQELFDYMGMSVRVKDWRYSTFCRWDGTRLAANWSACEGAELYNHSADTSLYDVDDNGEPFNLAGSAAATAGVERELLGLLRKRFL